MKRYDCLVPGCPWHTEADDAADRIIEGLRRGDVEIHFPKRLSIPMKLWTALPRPVYEYIARKMMAG